MTLGDAFPGDPSTMFLGTYTSSQGGQNSGIEVLRIDTDGLVSGQLASAPADNPSFLAFAGRTIVAVSETSPGWLLSWNWENGALEPRSKVPSGGDQPCHVIAKGNHLVAVNYDGAVCSSFALSIDGVIEPLHQKTLDGGGSGHSPRQRSSHLHSTANLNIDNRALVADLGSDRLVEIDVGGEGIIVTRREVSFGLGSGPRHIAFADNHVFVLCEIDQTLHCLDLPDYRRLSATARQDRPGALASHLEVDPARSLVYTAIRGADVMRVYRFDDDYTLHLLQEVACGGTWPRHFALSGNRLFVANQMSSSIAVFLLDPFTGLIADLLQVYAVASPACIVLQPS